MRYKELLSEQQLDELRMSPGSLRAFASSTEAKGIRAGFEAELVFTGLGGEAEYDEDPEPDYDADERTTSIQQVIDFFSNDEYGYAAYGRDLDNLQDGLDEKYMEWSDDQMYQISSRKCAQETHHHTCHMLLNRWAQAAKQQI
jgi:hypothetical protein